MQSIKYKGYIGEITLDLDADILHGEVTNARSVLTFSAKNVGDLKSAMAETVEDYIAWCKQRGVEPDRPYSGALSLRLPVQLHRAVAEEATNCRASINTYIVKVLERATCGDGERLLLAEGTAVWETARPKVRYDSATTTFEFADRLFTSDAVVVSTRRTARMH